MLRFFSRRRFNYIDIIGLGIIVGLMSHSLWWLLLCVPFAAISYVAEEAS